MHSHPGYADDKQQLLARLLLDEHLQHCVAGAAASGDSDRTEHLVHEASKAVERLLRA